MYQLRLACPSLSFRGYAKCLSQLSSEHHRNSNVDQRVISDAYHLYYRAVDEIKQMGGVDMLVCPACEHETPEGQRPLYVRHVMVDGLLKLFRFSNSRCTTDTSTMFDGRLFVRTTHEQILRDVAAECQKKRSGKGSDSQGGAEAANMCGPTTWQASDPSTKAAQHSTHAQGGINMGVCPHNLFWKAVIIRHHEVMMDTVAMQLLFVQPNNIGVIWKVCILHSVFHS